jgi:flagellar hook-length control protein FliK
MPASAASAASSPAATTPAGEQASAAEAQANATTSAATSGAATTAASSTALTPATAMLTLLSPGQLAGSGAAGASTTAAPAAKATQIQAAVGAGTANAGPAATPINPASRVEIATSDENDTGGGTVPSPNDGGTGGQNAATTQASGDNSGLNSQAASQTTLAPAPASAAMNAAAPAAMAAAHGADITAQLAAQITSRANTARTAFDFALEPQGLGRVDVSLKIDPQGQLSAVLSFNNPNAAAEAKSRAGDLQQALQQAGFDVGQSGLSFTSGGGQGAAGQGAAQVTFAQAPLVADSLADPTPTASTSARLAASAGGLDITI